MWETDTSTRARAQTHAHQHLFNIFLGANQKLDISRILLIDRERGREEGRERGRERERGGGREGGRERGREGGREGGRQAGRQAGREREAERRREWEGRRQRGVLHPKYLSLAILVPVSLLFECIESAKVFWYLFSPSFDFILVPVFRPF